MLIMSTGLSYSPSTPPPPHLSFLAKVNETYSAVRHAYYQDKPAHHPVSYTVEILLHRRKFALTGFGFP